MLQNLLYWDKKLFFTINLRMTSSWLDRIMAIISGDFIWVFIALLAFIVAIRKRRWDVLKLFALMGVVVLIADYFSYQILKPYFNRLRPCKTYDIVRMVADMGCGGWHSFPSNHAINSMIVATFSMIYGPRRIGIAFFIFSILVGYSRIYLGVHYPLDVFCGFILGFLIAIIGSSLDGYLGFSSLKPLREN